MSACLYLLDTNILAEPLRPKPNPQVMKRIEEHSDVLCTSVINWQEMLFGLHRMPPSRRRDTVQHYLLHTLKPNLPLLTFDAPAANWQAEQRAQLSLQGQTPSYADSQIAAVAASNGLILVTRNLTDFQCFDGLTLENWFARSRAE